MNEFLSKRRQADDTLRHKDEVIGKGKQPLTASKNVSSIGADDRTHLFVSEDKKQEPTYDIAISCNPALCSDSVGFWSAKIIEENFNETIDGVAIGILGNCNRGKTWLLARLANCKLPGVGLTQKTQGLSVKLVKMTDETTLKTFTNAIIDTAGINSSINTKQKYMEKDEDENEIENNDSLAKEKRSEEGKSFAQKNTFSEEDLDSSEKIKEQKLSYKSFEEHFFEKATEIRQVEKFQIKITLRLSNCIIIVINETTFSDQMFLRDIVREWMALTSVRSTETLHGDRDIYVVHNFIQTKNPDERNKRFKMSTNMVYSGYFKEHEEGIPVFTCTNKSFCSRHVCLMCDDVDEGKNYNDKVFRLLQQWVHRSVHASKTFSLANVFERFCSDLESERSRGYLHNVDHLDVQFFSNKSKFLPEKKKRKINSRTRPTEGSFAEGYVPLSTTFTYRSKAGNLCRAIFIELPGVEKESVYVDDVYEASIARHSAIALRGKKEKLKLTKISSNHFDEKLDKFFFPSFTDYQQVNEDEDDCFYGEICRIYQIPLEFDTDCKQLWLDGSLVLLFSEKERK